MHAPSVVSLPAVLLAPGLTHGVHAPSNYQPAPSSGAATVFAHAYLQGVAILALSRPIWASSVRRTKANSPLSLIRRHNCSLILSTTSCTSVRTNIYSKPQYSRRARLLYCLKRMGGSHGLPLLRRILPFRSFHHHKRLGSSGGTEQNFMKISGPPGTVTSANQSPAKATRDIAIERESKAEQGQERWLLTGPRRRPRRQTTPRGPRSPRAADRGRPADLLCSPDASSAGARSRGVRRRRRHRSPQSQGAVSDSAKLGGTDPASPRPTEPGAP